MIRFFCPSDIQSTCKAEKKGCVFLALQGNREFKVLCSCHSIARPPSLCRPANYPRGKITLHLPYIYITSTLHLSLLDQSPIDRLTGSFDTLIAEVILDRSRE